MAHILTYMFNSVSRQCSEVWASWFPFLHSLRDVIPPSEVCLYGHINWSLAQVYHQSSVGLSQYFPPKRGGKARPQTGLHFIVQKRPNSGSVPGPSGTSLGKRPHLECGNEAHPSGKKSAVAVSPPVLHMLGYKGAVGISASDVPESSSSSAFPSSIFAAFQVGMLFKFFLSMENHYMQQVCAYYGSGSPSSA